MTGKMSRQLNNNPYLRKEGTHGGKTNHSPTKQTGLSRFEYRPSPIAKTRNPNQFQEAEMSNRIVISIMLVALLMCAGWPAAGGVPETINYQGMLTTPTGDTVPSDNYQIVFRIYGASSGGTALWTSGTHDTPVAGGLFTCRIGSIVPFPQGLFATDADRWLGITVGDDPEMSPRTLLTSVPYAIHTRMADTSRVGGGWEQTGDIIALVPEGDKVGINTNNPQANLHVSHGGGSQDALRVDHQSYFPYEHEDLLTVTNDGRVGIGTATPSLNSRLHINSTDLGIDDNQLYNDLVIVDEDEAGIGLFTRPVGAASGLISMSQVDGGGAVIDKWSIVRESQSGGNGLRFTYGPASDPLGNPTAVRMDAQGDVGIGIEDPGNHKLFVISSNGGTGGRTAHISNTNTVDGTALLVQNASDQLALLVSQTGEHPDGVIFRCDSWTGGWHRVFAVKNSGRVICGELELTGGSDIAEPFEITGDDIPKGAVVIIDEDNPGKLKMSGTAYDTRVAGIVSGAGGVKPGIMLTQEEKFEGQQHIAISGRVYCQVDASYGEIKPGDLLTTSPTPGHAMKASDREQAYGAVIGKAMTGLDKGQGLVLVLVNLQ